MSRSIGDNVATGLGVSCEPEIKEFHFSNFQCGFVLIGSDGLWEFLRNEYIMNGVEEFFIGNDIEKACSWIEEQAYLSWKSKEENSVDDITFILIFI